MVPGLNHNIRYQGDVYHVQTEDHGSRQRKFTTHLFRQGRVLAELETHYKDFETLKETNPRDTAIRRAMQKQHKKVLKSLVSGTYDDKIRETAPKTAIIKEGGKSPSSAPPVSVSVEASSPPQPANDDVAEKAFSRPRAPRSAFTTQTKPEQTRKSRPARLDSNAPTISPPPFDPPQNSDFDGPTEDGEMTTMPPNETTSQVPTLSAPPHETPSVDDMLSNFLSEEP